MDKLISTSEYYDHHESIEELHGIPDDFINHVQCCSCGEYFPSDEIIPIGHDDLCLDCAECAGIHRCNCCGEVFEQADHCPSCGWNREG